jgi:hypothetical protein
MIAEGIAGLIGAVVGTASTLFAAYRYQEKRMEDTRAELGKAMEQAEAIERALGAYVKREDCVGKHDALTTEIRGIRQLLDGPTGMVAMLARIDERLARP